MKALNMMGVSAPKDAGTLVLSSASSVTDWEEHRRESACREFITQRRDVGGPLLMFKAWLAPASTPLASSTDTVWGPTLPPFRYSRTPPAPGGTVYEVMGVAQLPVALSWKVMPRSDALRFNVTGNGDGAGLP